jgi:tRNA(Ile)-lysidine synthase
MKRCEVEEAVRTFVNREQLLTANERHLVALSGGADSVALLRILLRLGYGVEAVHCNFHLRGDESNRDEQFVKQLCEHFQVPLHLIHFDTVTYAEAHQVSIEMAARELRYTYFEQLRRDIGAETVCVAHHRDDSVETVLMKLIRGTGIHGVCGICPRNRHIVRPLLCVSRTEIEAYLDAIGQQYVDDSTNFVDDVVRNKIRLNVIPLLKQINPNVSENIQRSAAHLSEAERVYNAAIASAKNRLWREGTVDIDELCREPSPQSLLFEWLRPLDFTPDVISQIVAALDGPTGRCFLSPTHEAVIDRGRLVVGELHEPPRPLVIPETGTYIFDDDCKFRIELKDGAEVSREQTVATLDADKVQFPLTVRTVQQADRFVPFGMKGSRLVSDFLTDRKLSLMDKRRQLAVTDACGQIIWLVGHRTDDRCRIDSATQRTLVISRLQPE